MKIFIDVGGHYGETLHEIFKPKWLFDVVHCFEPQFECHNIIAHKFYEQIKNGKLILYNFGLADFDGEHELFGGGTSSIGASLFCDKNDIDNREIEKCRFVSISTFIQKNIKADDFVVMKLNCEGGEILILRDLMKSKTIYSFDSIYIDFDIRKIPSQQTEEKKVIAELKTCDFNNYVLAGIVDVFWIFSFSKKYRVPRSLEYGYKGNRIWLWLITSLPNPEIVCCYTLSDKLIRFLPKLIWGRALRMRHLFVHHFLRPKD